MSPRRKTALLEWLDGDIPSMLPPHQKPWQTIVGSYMGLRWCHDLSTEWHVPLAKCCEVHLGQSPVLLRAEEIDHRPDAGARSRFIAKPQVQVWTLVIEKASGRRQHQVKQQADNSYQCLLKLGCSAFSQWSVALQSRDFELGSLDTG